MGGAVNQGRWGRPRRRFTVSRQTVTAAVAAGCFISTAAILMFVPVPYVMYSPGNAYDIFALDAEKRPTVSVSGVPTYPVSGELRMTTVSVTRSDANLTLPEVVFGQLSPSHDVLPRENVYPEGKSAEQVQSEERQMMDTSQQEAIVAALREAGQPVEEIPVVASVVTDGPSDGILMPGDFVLEVDGEPVQATSDIPEHVQQREPGDEITLKVLGADTDEPEEVTVPVEIGPEGTPRIGIGVELGYQYDAEVNFGVREGIGGPSAGLVFALGIYEQVTPGDLVAGRDIAGTGTIDVDGRVGPIGGIREKIHGAEKAGAEVFLVPAENCRDVVGLRTDAELVRVDDLAGVVDALDGDGPMPRCG